MTSPLSWTPRKLWFSNSKLSSLATDVPKMRPSLLGIHHSMDYGPSSDRRVLRNLTSEPLDAGKIMEEIEKRIKEVIPELGDITKASIHIKSDGGVATMKE